MRIEYFLSKTRKTLVCLLLMFTSLEADERSHPEKETLIKVNAQIQQLHEKMTELHRQYMSLMEEAAGYDLEAESVRKFNLKEYHRLQSRSKQKHEAAEEVFKEFEKLKIAQANLLNDQIHHYDDEIRNLMNKEEKLQIEADNYRRQANELADASSEEYRKLMSLAEQKEKEIDLLRDHYKKLRLERKLLLMEGGDPDNQSESPYQF